MIDPAKASQRNQITRAAIENWHKRFDNLNISQAYEKLFELLWYSRLPCFDVMDVTSQEKDEMSLIKRCYWRSQLIDCASVFTTHLTDRGVCCAFNAGSAEKIYKKSRGRIFLNKFQKVTRLQSFVDTKEGYVQIF